MFNKGTLAATLMVAVLSLAAAACGSAAADTPTVPSTTADPAEYRSAGNFLGLPVEEAGTRAEEQGRLWRIIKEDGVDLAVTADYSEDRLNFTVDDGVVVAAVTDAELVKDDTGPSSCAGQEPMIDDGEVIGVFDVNADGHDEIFGVIDDDGELVQIGIWTWDASCSLHRVALDGSPAVLGVGHTESIAEGVSCNPDYVDDLYTIKLTSSDGGSTYEGRITAYSLEGSDLVEASGEGAAFPAEDVAVTAILACGELTYP